MAVLISCATGNFTAAATWEVVDSTSFLDSEAANTVLSSTPADSAASLPGSITIDGIAVKIAARASSPSGTMTITLRNTSDNLDVTSVTINVSDLPAISSSVSPAGWFFFKFGASQALNGVKNYAVRASTSGANQVTLYRNATASNWSRAFRKTTTQAPASGDQLIICGEYTGAGTGNSFTVTMNNTASTSFGATSQTQSVTVGSKGTFTYGTSASTNYLLKVAGVIAVYADGVMTMGTLSSPVPSSSTAALEFVCVAAGDSGLVVANLGTFTTFGATRNFFKTKLAANVAAAGTSLTTTDSTGWKSGDVICIASTSRTATECESATLSVDASGTTLTVGALANAHSGTSPTQAEVGLLTHFVKIRGTSSTLTGYVNIGATAVVSLSYTEVYWLGSAIAQKQGFQISTTTGSFTMSFCSAHDYLNNSSSQLFQISGSTSNNYTFNYVICYNFSVGFGNTQTTGTSWTVDNCIFMLHINTSGLFLVQLADVGGTFTNNVLCGGRATSSGPGLYLADDGGTVGTMSGNVSHSNSGNGIAITNSSAAIIHMSGTISSTTLWRNSGVGLASGSYCGGGDSDLIFDGLTAFGNTTANIQISGASSFVIRNGVFNSDASFSTLVGFDMAAAMPDVRLESCTFGVTTNHATADVRVNTSGSGYLTLINCLLSSTTEVTFVSPNFQGAYVGSQKHDQTVGNHKTWRQQGIVSIDSTIYCAGSPSLRMTPSSTTAKLPSYGTRDGFLVPVISGATVTGSCKVRRSTAADGAAYNGNSPRLMQRSNPAIGVNSDTLIATAGAAVTGSITAATNASPIVITSAAHGLSTGDRITIAGVLGNTAANGNWAITVVDANTFSLTSSTGNGTYTSGGTWSKWLTLSGTTGSATDDGCVEFFVDCDGTTGWVNIDDFSAS